MSLIADALKTAQREKQRRETGSGPGEISPVLVPMRTVAEPSSTRQKLTMVISVIVTIGAIVVLVQRMKAVLSPASQSLAATSTATLPPLESATRPAARDSTPARSVVVPRAMQPLPFEPRSTTPPRSARVVAQSTPGAAAPDSATTARAEKAAESTATRAPQVQSAGGLRIAIEQPRHAEAAAMFADALAAHRADDLSRARDLYEGVLQLESNHADALNNLGVLLSSQREFDRALALLRRAASVAPNSAGTWNNIGTALREQGRGSDAIAAFRHALTLDPQHHGAKVGLAQQYLAIGSVSQARGLLEDVIRGNPGLAEAHYALGQALEMQGDRTGAIREYSAFISLAPARLALHIERTRRHVDSLSSRAP